MARTKRTQRLIEGAEKLLKDFKRLEELQDKYVEFYDETHKLAGVYAKDYIDSQCETARQTKDRACVAIAESCLKVVEGMIDTLENTTPEPVNPGSVEATNMLNMLNLTQGRLSFEQLRYFVDKSRGDLALLQLLADVFETYFDGENYEMKTAAAQAREAATDVSLYRLQEAAGKLASIQYEKQYTGNNAFMWTKAELKKYIERMNPAVVDEPDYAVVVANMKRRIRQLESERDAAKFEASENKELLNAAVERLVLEKPDSKP